MKKSFYLLLVLLCTSVAGVISIFSFLIKEKDQVQLKETVLYGNVSALEGLVVKNRTHYNYNLFWNTEYSPGENSSIHTEYEFHTLDEKQNIPIEYAGVNFIEYSSGHSFSGDEGEYTGLDLAYKELFDRTKPGEERSETIYLHDYLDYYPIEGWVETTDINLYWDSSMTDDPFCKKIVDYFKIPVIEDETRKITVTKDKNGDLIRMGESSSDSDIFYLWTESVAIENGCYFSFPTQTLQGKIIDTSMLPDGYGIFYITYEKEEGSVTDINVSMIYEMDPSVKFIDIYTHQEESRILIITIEDDMYVLTVLDSETHKILQRLEMGETDGQYMTFVYDDFLVQILTQEKLTVIELNETGQYEQQFTIVYSNEENSSYYPSYNDVMDWSGEKLAIASYQVPENYYSKEANDFCLTVYDASGMLYYGEYESSLSTGESFSDYQYYCRPVDYNPLEIVWS